MKNNIIITRIIPVQVDPRRKQEFIDSQIIQEDYSAMSNLPMHPINKQWQRNLVYTNPYEDLGV